MIKLKISIKGYQKDFIFLQGVDSENPQDLICENEELMAFLETENKSHIYLPCEINKVKCVAQLYLDRFHKQITLMYLEF